MMDEGIGTDVLARMTNTSRVGMDLEVLLISLQLCQLLPLDIFRASHLNTRHGPMD